MKREISALLCAVLLGSLLSSCGGETNGEVSVDNQMGSAQESELPVETYTYVQGDVTIAVNAEMAPVAEQLGEPTGYFESESCAFQGMDKVYTYGSIVISTYPEDDTDYILSIELKDDTVSTPEGISIGDAKDTVVSAYGEPSLETDAALSYQKGDCTLAFILDGNVVDGITYTSALMS